MIEIPKTLLNQVREGEKSIEEIINFLQMKYPMYEILKGYAELAVTAEEYINRPPITVTRQEFEAIMAMFKIKGERFLDGAIVSETRGRPRKIITAPKSEE
jgi:hypothetical protein